VAVTIRRPLTSLLRYVPSSDSRAGYEVPDRWVNPEGWGPNRPSQPSSSDPTQPLSQQPGRPPVGGPPNPNPMWRRKGFWFVSGSIAALLLVVALWPSSHQTGPHAAATTAPAQSAVLATTAPSSSTASPTTTPPTTIPKVEVPRLVGMTTARAKRVLSDRGLRGRVTYKTTARYATGTVISQSRRSGTSVAPGAVVTLVIAKAPPPTTPPSTAAPSQNCDPAYPDDCLQDGIGDYDCAGGSGNGPNYVEGPITVLPPDPFGLDGNRDGVGCEQG